MAGTEDETTALWENARGYAGLFGAIPSSFSSTIRALMQDANKGLPTAGPASRYNALRLLKSQSCFAPFVFATMAYHPDKVSDPAKVRPEQLLEIYKPLELATFLGLIYLHRRAKKLVSADDWSHIEPIITRQVEVAVHVGYALGAVGPALAALVGGIPGIVFSAFCKHDAKGFKEYRRHLKSKTLFSDLDLEVSRWACMHPQVGSALVQTLGLGVQVAESFAVGLMCRDPNGEGLTDDAYRFFIVRVWMEAMMKTGDIPDITHKGKYYPLKEAVDKIRIIAKEVKEKGPKYNWLEKTKDSLEGEALEAIEEVEDVDESLEETE